MAIYDPINNITIEGRLVKDPEISYTANTQTAVCRLRMATPKPYRKGVDQESSFFNVVVWDRLAEDCNRDLTKGKKVTVSGRLEQRTYPTKDGRNAEIVEIVAEKVKYDRPKHQDNGNYGDPANLPPAMQQAPQGNMPPQANVPAAGVQQMGFQDMPADDEQW